MEKKSYAKFKLQSGFKFCVQQQIQARNSAIDMHTHVLVFIKPNLIAFAVETQSVLHLND